MPTMKDILKRIDTLCHESFNTPESLQQHLEEITKLFDELRRIENSSYSWLETSVKQSIMFNFNQSNKDYGQSKLSEPATLVYLLKATNSEIYKIGVSGDVSRRINELQNFHHEPLELIATGRGGRKLEAKLHRKYDFLRVKGEWFKLSDLELDEITSLLNGGSDA